MDIAGFKTIQEKDASSEITDNLNVYGSDVLTTKIPSYLDGLKASTRRIVYFSREHKESVGLTKIIGEIGDFHTSGTTSIYDAIVRLGQSFMVGNPLMQIDGKSGEYAAPDAAAAERYLYAKLSTFSDDVYFKDINLKTLPMQSSKDFKASEPIHLVPKIPMALVLGNLTIGFGYKSQIPMIDLKNVCDLVVYFAEFYKNNGTDFYKIPNASSVAKYFVPAFPIDNLIKNRPELIEHYEMGDFTFPIEYEGECELNGDSITLHAVPYGVNFNEVTTKLRVKMSEKHSELLNYLVTAKQFSTDLAEFYIEIKRGQNPFEILEMLKPMLKFNGSFHPHYNFVRDGKVANLNPLTVVYYWYRERYQNIAAGLRYAQAKNSNDIYEQEALLLICDFLDEVISIIKKSDEGEEAKNLRNRFKELTMRQADVICNQPLRVLSHSTRKTVEKNLEDLHAKRDELIDKFTHINESIAEDAQVIRKKYGYDTITSYADNFIGCVQFGNLGCIQFANEEDMFKILTSKWPATINKSIHLYRNGSEKYLLRNGRIVPMKDNARQICCESIIAFPPGSSMNYTLAINDSGSTCIIEREVREVRSNFVLCPISEKFYAIHRDGRITEEDVSNYTKRKSVSSGAKTDLIYGLPKRSKDLVVFHMNDTNPNVVRIDRILLNKDNLGKLTAVPSGNMHILGIYSLRTKGIYLNVPTTCTKNIRMNFLVVKNISAVFADDKINNIVLDVGKSSGLNKKLKRSKIVRTLYTLDLRDSEE